jgi:prolyl-tRNA synthetase
MKQSELFTKTRKEAPKDEVSKNAELLIRAGYIHKEMAGVYSYMPLGLRVLNNLVGIIREEMNAIGGQELSLTALQDKTLWQRTDRWDDEKVDNWFKTNFKSGGETGLAITHEEPLTRIMSEYISSYRDLPVYAYQFQNKFRNEIRAKSGIMRGREFLMKDLYSFSKDEAGHKEFYDKARQAYQIIFKRAGIGDKTYPTFASGGIFSKYSEEFQTESAAGEDAIYLDEKKGIAVNKEVLSDEVLKDLGLNKKNLVEKKTIEVGNIFNLGTKFSEPLGLLYLDEKGQKQPVIMGSYGIGLGRLMGTIVEVLADEKGIVWPESVAPFKIHLIYVPGKNSNAKKQADGLYQKLTEKAVEVLYDDRDLRAGEKFADADLIGIPWRVIVSDKTIESGQLELKSRATGEVKMILETELFKRFPI